MGARRTVILEAAEKLLRHYGPDKTTMADIARSARVAVGTLYLEFDSKEAIVDALARSTHDEVLERMRARAAAATPEDAPHAFVDVLVVRTRGFFSVRKKGQHACELVHCQKDAVKAAHDRFLEAERELLVGLFARGRDAGAFAPRVGGSDEALARTVQRALVCLTPPWLYDHEPREAERQALALAELLVDGLRVR